MLTLQNFETHLDAAILKRGKQYYQQKAIISLEESANGEWVAEIDCLKNYNLFILSHQLHTIFCPLFF